MVLLVDLPEEHTHQQRDYQTDRLPIGDFYWHSSKPLSAASTLRGFACAPPYGLVSSLDEHLGSVSLAIQSLAGDKMVRVPFIGRLALQEYLALIGSFILVGLELLIRVITLALRKISNPGLGIERC